MRFSTSTARHDILCTRNLNNCRLVNTAMLHSINTFLDKLLAKLEGTALNADELRIATAALLVHATTIDGRVTEEETVRLRELLTAHFKLSEDELQVLLNQAELRERESVDIYRFTAPLRDGLSPEAKCDIIEMMWHLVYADGELAPIEDNLIWRTSELLAVPARDRMELKKKVRGEG